MNSLYSFIQETIDPETGDILDSEDLDSLEELRVNAANAAAKGDNNLHFAIVREPNPMNGDPKGWAYVRVEISQLSALIRPAIVVGNSLAPDPDDRWVIRSASGEELCKLPSALIAQLRRPVSL